MKVLALVILVVGSTYGLGSGPYLPSGWRPAGPAFYLPMEVEKPAVAAVKSIPIQESKEYEALKIQIEESGDVKANVKETSDGSISVQEPDAANLQVESEASGSDAFREYGPPKEVSQDITQQALPDSVTEQAFIVIETKSQIQNEVNSEITSEENTEDKGQPDTSSIAEDVTTEKLAEVTEAEKIEETAQVEINQKNTEDSNVVGQEQKTVEIAQVRSGKVGVEDIADALVNLENEIKDQQVELKEEVIEVKSAVQGSTQSSPEGFLEYGPPGFTEYGPPKGDLKTTAEEKIAFTNEVNEVRRRRFSPRFKAPTQKH